MNEQTWNDVTPAQAAALREIGPTVIVEPIPTGTVEIRLADQRPVQMPVKNAVRAARNLAKARRRMRRASRRANR